MNLNLWKMTQWIIHALILSAVVFWIPYGAFAYGGVTWDPQCVLCSMRAFVFCVIQRFCVCTEAKTMEWAWPG